MLQVSSFINDLMNSNCHILWDDTSRKCMVIDPASEKSEREISFINEHSLQLDYIFMTHEHSDHTWGVNVLIEHYDAKVICSEACKNGLPQQGNALFRFYQDRATYNYCVSRVDYTTEELGNELSWDDYTIKFIPTPGHSISSVCLYVENILFTGDALMQYKPVIIKRSGGNKKDIYDSIKMLKYILSGNTIVYPGHGKPFLLKEHCII